MIYLLLKNFCYTKNRHYYRSDLTIPDAIHQWCSHDMYYHRTQTGNNSSLHSLSYDGNLSERNNELLLQMTDRSVGMWNIFLF